MIYRADVYCGRESNETKKKMSTLPCTPEYRVIIEWTVGDAFDDYYASATLSLELLSMVFTMLELSALTF